MRPRPDPALQPAFATDLAGDPGIRLLLIAYHFPPANSAGALRWQKMARFIAERGWGLDVISRKLDASEPRDEHRLHELPGGVRIFEVDEVAPLTERIVDGLRRGLAGACRPAAPGTASASTPGPGPRADSRSRNQVMAEPWSRRDCVRSYHAWLDFRRGRAWANAAAELGERILDPARHRIIVSCGPPHMATHGAGLRLARRRGCPLVTDLRDPWSQVQRMPEALATRLWFWLADRYERRAVAAAARVVMNTNPAAEKMREVYPEAADRILAIMNGCDGEMREQVGDRPRFSIRYAGAIYFDRDPMPLLRATGRVIERLSLSPRQISVEFMGDLQDFEKGDFNELVAAAGLESFVRMFPRSPREEALRFQSDAAVLVSLPQDSDLAIPSKIFEYMSFAAWLLIIDSLSSAPAQLLQGTGADVVSPGDELAIADALERRYREWERGVRPEPLGRDPRFQRRAQAERLMAVFEQVMEVHDRERSRSS